MKMKLIVLTLMVNGSTATLITGTAPIQNGMTAIITKSVREIQQVIKFTMESQVKSSRNGQRATLKHTDRFVVIKKNTISTKTATGTTQAAKMTSGMSAIGLMKVMKEFTSTQMESFRIEKVVTGWKVRLKTLFKVISTVFNLDLQMDLQTTQNNQETLISLNSRFK